MSARVFRLLLTAAVFLYVALYIAEARELSCAKHPTYCQIVKNAPHLDRDTALQISNIIHKISSKHKVPVRIFTGILAQESNYKLEAKGCHKGLIKEEVEPKYLSLKRESSYVIKEIKVCADFGIGQIYYKTAEGFGFDIYKLTSDLEYSIEAAAIVLADFQRRYSAREVDWWTRYNASSNIKRKIYKKLVERYL